MAAQNNVEQWLKAQHKRAEKGEVHPYREWIFTPPEGEPETYQVAIIRDSLSTTVICPELKLATEDEDHLEAQFKLTHLIKEARAYPSNVTIGGTSVPPFVMTWGEKATRMTTPAKYKSSPELPKEGDDESLATSETKLERPQPKTDQKNDLADAMNNDDQGDLLDLFTQEPSQ